MTNEELIKMLANVEKRIVNKKKEVDKVMSELGALCTEALSLQKKIKDNGG